MHTTKPKKLHILPLYCPAFKQIDLTLRFPPLLQFQPLSNELELGLDQTDALISLDRKGNARIKRGVVGGDLGLLRCDCDAVDETECDGLLSIRK